MWFCQPLGQIEPLLVVAALVAAFSSSIYYRSTDVVDPANIELLSPLSKFTNDVFTLVTPLALLGAFLAISYGWFPGNEYLATGSLACVSLALLLLLVAVVITGAELRFPKIRNIVFMPQFDEGWEKDLADLKGESSTTEEPEASTSGQVP